MRISEWENTKVGDIDLTELDIATDDTDKIHFRLSTYTKSPELYKYLDEARENNGVEFKHSSDDAFYNQILDLSAELIQNTIRKMKENEAMAKNVSTLLKDNLENINRIIPTRLIVTGNNNNVVCYYEAA